MRIKNNRKIKYSAALLMILTFSSILAILPINFNSTEIAGKNEEINDVVDFNSPSLSTISNASWWNVDFQWRQCINITNPYDDDLVDDAVSIRINHTKYFIQGNMQNDLDDIRIVENGILRDYYFTTDYPNGDMAIIWFEANISAQTTDYDTYLYFGNDSISLDASYYKEDRFGLAWYTFDEDIIAGTVKDSMGKNNATLNGLGVDVAYVSGYSGSALDFDDTQTNAYIDAPNTIINGLTDFTICFWATAGTAGEYLISGSSGSNHNYMLMRSPTEGGWHFYVWRRNSSGIHIYKDLVINDGLVYTNPGSPITIASGGFIIAQEQDSLGGGFSSSQAFHGEIDDMRFFNSGLSDRELRWLYYDYSLDIELLPEQELAATVKVIVKDIDGRAVSGAKVFLFNTTNQINYTSFTNELGIADFLNIKNLLYNITVNYTINNGIDEFEKVVFDSSVLKDYYDFKWQSYEVFIDVNLWTIDFEIEDWDYEPMGYGYVLVYNNSGYSELLANLTLNKEYGTQTFRWVNTSNDAKYFYEVYYENADYEQPRTLVNKSYVDRTYYLNNKKNENSQQILVDNTNIEDQIDPKYRVNHYFYTSDSSSNHIGNIKLINTTITLSNMNDDLTDISIYNINKIGQADELLYNDVFSGVQTSATISLNISEVAIAYGLRVDISGTNSSTCNGVIEVNFTEAYNQYVRVNMSKIIINVYDTIGTPDPMSNVYVLVINGTQGAGEEIVTLLTDEQGIAKGIKVPELDFWYITNTKYNFTLKYFDTTQIFNVTSDQYTTPPDTFIDVFNYTLVKKSSIEFKIRLNLDNYTTEFQNSTWDTDLEWENNFFFRVRFVSTTNALDDPPTWSPINNPDYVKWEIKDRYGYTTIDSGNMILEGNGYCNYTFDSTSLNGNEQYLFFVDGKKTGFQDPDPALMLFTVSPKATSLGVYNTTSMANLGDNVIQYYGELIDLTVLYSSYGVYLTGATVTYDWQFTDTPVTISEGGPGEYSFVIDTSIADVGIYQLRISASLDNYSAVTNYRFDIHIITRPTSLNGDTSLHHISKMIWVKEEYNFTFEYKDILTEPHEKLGDLDIAYYQWYKLYPNGTIQGAISDTINLIEAVNNTYNLDFDTESREIGSYAIIVTFSKNNYEVRTALIDLTIVTRTFNYLLNATNLAQSQIKIIQGQDARIELQLTDESNNDAPLLGATVILKVGSTDYSLTDDDNDGVYTYTFETDDINAFFAIQVIPGEISIIKEDFVSQSFSLTIVVGMPEIFPGFPMFYFLMIIGLISLVVYRTIQQARIPTFVKKVREMSKNIKGRKSISDSLLYPSKEEYLVKILGDKWEMLGLSLEEILGVDAKKKKKLPETKEFKGGAE
jgi:hypothetical protein